MKMRHFVLLFAISVCAIFVACRGAHLKYGILRPLGLYQDKSVLELPFLMHSDDFLRFMVENADELRQMEQETPPPPVTPGPTQGTTAPDNSTGPSSSATQPSQTPPSSSEPSSSATAGTSIGQEATMDSSTTLPPSSSTTLPPSSSTTQSTTGPVSTGPNFDFPSGVDNAWFDNVLFIGDSRVVGLREYARSGNADYFCDVGMTVFSYQNKSLSDKNFSSQTLDSLLSSRQYDKIIINFGLNEAGYPLSSFKLAYSKFVNMVREKQPNAVIVLQGVMSVTEPMANTASYFTPAYLGQMSAYIQSLCDGVKTYYIDCNEYFADERGYLYASITNDGYHPTGSGYRHWRNWIAFALEEIGL